MGRRVKRDEDGAVFFDFNPQYFGYILEYLRTKKIATPEDPAELPKVLRDEAKNFNTLVEYLQLSDEIAVPVEIVPPGIVPSEKFNFHASTITLQEDRKVAVHRPNQSSEYALGENTYERGIVRLRLKLESFENNFWMFVGILKGNVLQQSQLYSYSWPGSYGWGLGSNSQVVKNGSYALEDSLKNLTKQGDTVELV